jgi:DNA-binding Lrp family transcriptional regulator
MYPEVNMGETQRFNVKGSEILERVKQLIHEGNIRRVRLLHDERTIIEIPLTIGAPAAVVGILAAPLLAAIGAFAALVTECTIEVEKVEEK